MMKQDLSAAFGRRAWMERLVTTTTLATLSMLWATIFYQLPGVYVVITTGICVVTWFAVLGRAWTDEIICTISRIPARAQTAGYMGLINQAEPEPSNQLRSVE